MDTHQPAPPPAGPNDGPLLPLTTEERVRLAEFGAQLSLRPGRPVALPADVLAALNRVMAPVDAALYESLVALRRTELRG